MIDRRVIVGSFQCNCHILVCEKTRNATVIDPGDEPQKILKALKELGDPEVHVLLHTHAHLDHIGATRALCEALEARQGFAPEIALHTADEDLYLKLKTQGALFGMTYDDPLALTRRLQDAEGVSFGALELEVIHTPGHSPGGVCFRIGDTLYSGDTLFSGSIGRTDLWGGDTDLLLKSIRRRLFTLEDDLRVCPGHGSDTSIGIERASNPFLR